ncbi:glycoside hydrolase family 30 protein [Asticcacaulis taihuensis]|uniref:glycoside hydrolase family 30 protein n=1 Tax=Asticcacaulis taihuensis TaxID=260084 RepID=UPI0026F07DD3|nr:glycoside hydrolase family 30 beta sandwich domain-containing protein [Asticcacaulis taihuensis]
MRIFQVAVLAALMGLSGCATGGLAGGHSAVKVWETDADQSKLLAPQADVRFGKASGTVITVDPAQSYQSMVGFGAAMTDASAYLIRNKMTDAQRDALMSDLFGAEGLNFSFMRLTIGASDFSREHYSYDDMPKGESDPQMAHFSINAAKTDVIPAVKQALALNPKLTVMASPWSAPGWMKTTDSLIQGSLKPEAYPWFADYLSRYLKDMRAEGVDITLLTLQNEPGFEPDSYPGMRVEPESRAAFIGGYLGPKLKADGDRTKILDYDHNWDLPSSPLTVLDDAKANPYVSGVAWHCYNGDVAAQGPVHEAHPDKDAYFTECSGGEWAPKFGDTFDWTVKNLIIGSTRNWAKGVLMWNLALDENFGPHKGGCSDCRGIVTINSGTGAVTKNIEYYAFGHASKFVKAGAVRVASNEADGISNVAFRNPDGSLVLIALNGNAAATAFSVKAGGKAFGYTLPAGAVATFVWRP